MRNDLILSEGNYEVSQAWASGDVQVVRNAGPSGTSIQPYPAAVPIVESWLQSLDNAITYTRIFPMLTVPLPDFFIYEWDRADGFRIETEEDNWDAGAEVPDRQFKLNKKNFETRPLGIGTNITMFDREIAAGQPYDLENQKMERIAQDFALSMEVRCLNIVFNSSNFQDITLGNGNWDVSGSTPREDIWKAIIKFEKQTGKRPNKAVVGPSVDFALANHDNFDNLIPDTQASTTEARSRALAGEFGLSDWVITRGVRNTAKEGAADATATVGNDALTGYINETGFVLIHAPDTVRNNQDASAVYLASFNGNRAVTEYGFTPYVHRLDSKYTTKMDVIGHNRPVLSSNKLMAGKLAVVSAVS